MAIHRSVEIRNTLHDLVVERETKLDAIKADVATAKRKLVFDATQAAAVAHKAADAVINTAREARDLRKKKAEKNRELAIRAAHGAFATEICDADKVFEQTHTDVERDTKRANAPIEEALNKAEATLLAEATVRTEAIRVEYEAKRKPLIEEQNALLKKGKKVTVEMAPESSE